MTYFKKYKLFAIKKELNKIYKQNLRDGKTSGRCNGQYISGITSELGRARDNSVATMWPCFQGTKLFVIVILLYLLWLPHLDTEA